MYESTYPKTASTNDDSKDGLSDPNEDPWSPSEDDDEPSVTVSINDEDGEEDLIESVKITGLENVDEVTVTVVDSNGDEVSVCFIAK